MYTTDNRHTTGQRETKNAFLPLCEQKRERKEKSEQKISLFLKAEPTLGLFCACVKHFVFLP